MSLPSPRSYSFIVPPDTNFVVIVNGVNSGSSGPYTLDVQGSDCVPRLNITQVATNRVKLDWTTASAGYSLESSNSFVPGFGWPTVPSTPVVVNSRFTVTNTLNTSNQFFRLRKPVP
jgi:hypothetical protein